MPRRSASVNSADRFRFNPDRAPTGQMNIKLPVPYINQLRLEAATAKMSMTAYVKGLLFVMSPPRTEEPDPHAVQHARDQIEFERKAAKDAAARDKAQAKIAAKRAAEDAKALEVAEQPNLALAEFFEEEL